MRISRQSAPTLVCGGGPLGFPPGLDGLEGPLPDAPPQRQELYDKAEPPRTPTGEISRRGRPERWVRRASSPNSQPKVGKSYLPSAGRSICPKFDERRSVPYFRPHLHISQKTVGITQVGLTLDSVEIRIAAPVRYGFAISERPILYRAQPADFLGGPHFCRNRGY